MKRVLFGMLLCLPFTACNDDVEEQSISPTMQPIELNATEKKWQPNKVIFPRFFLSRCIGNWVRE